MRKQSDIKIIRILTTIEGVNGWVVNIEYKDNKMATFTIDRSDIGTVRMLKITFDSILQQLKANDVR